MVLYYANYTSPTIMVELIALIFMLVLLPVLGYETKQTKTKSHITITIFVLWLVFVQYIIIWQFPTGKEIMFFDGKIFSTYDINLNLDVDRVSIIFLLLTSVIFPFCVLSATNIQKKASMFVAYLVMIELFLLIAFTTENLVVFYIFFESVLIPMFIIVGYWGSRERKVKAAFYLFLYTLAGSFFLLFGIFYIYMLTGSVTYKVILNTNYVNAEATWLWLLMFVPFAVKTPMYPWHIWLPEAHVEAPTIGSVILASLLLKLGGYGFIKLLFPITYNNNICLTPLVYSLALGGVIFGSLSTIRQIDIKKMIAYSSVAHMNLLVLGLFSLNISGIYGAIYLMVGHAFVSGGLFFCIGVLYDRYHTRLIRYYGGIVQTMPIFAIIFFYLTLGNMSFPTTSNFIGELLIFVGLLQSESVTNSGLVLIGGATGIILSAIYSIWVFNRIVFGTLKTKYISKFRDVSYTEAIILIPFMLIVCLLGLNSQILQVN